MTSRRRRLRAGALAAAAVLAGCGGASSMGRPAKAVSSASEAPAAAATAPAPPPPAPRSFAVGVSIVPLVDRSRTVAIPGGGRAPRSLTTIVRYPTMPGSGASARAYGPYPLIVFGHGFAVTPAIYSRLLRSWTEAGYVVAAPVFPLGNAGAPGGPDEADLVNQPADVRFVIGRMLAASRSPSGPLAGMVDPARIAVAGQSDGGDTALAVAYDQRFRDRRVRAAVVLSGAFIPYLSTFAFPEVGPPLLATQGSADTVNPPAMTEAFFREARPPKFLLWLPGAEHLPPYTTGEPQLGVVEHVTTAFLDHYLGWRPRTLAHVIALGRVPGVASIRAYP